LRDDYPLAEEFTKYFLSTVQSAKLSVSAQIDLWQIITNFPFPTRMFNALPSEFKYVDQTIKEGIRSVYQPQSTRSLEELDKIGRCMDKIRPGQSTIPQAGRGAFAAQTIQKDEVVIGTPLIFTPTDDFFRMYDGDWLLQATKPDNSKLKQMQLIINYSWKHPSSSLFLIPYGPLVQLINHNQTQANVKVQWANHGELSHDSRWLAHSPEAIFPQNTPGLFIDLIATRDIEPGEEIFMDYGNAWEEKWMEYVSNWQPPDDSETYQSAREWVEENPNAILRTEEEQGINPYPQNFEMRCLVDIISEVEMTNDEARALWHEKAESMLCTVQERRREPDGEYVYVVHYLPLGYVEEDGDTEDGMVNWYQSDWIPRGAITFADAAYTTDIFLPGAFRHPIGIPDEIMPNTWKDFQGTLYW
jgi:hypothetical protein